MIPTPAMVASGRRFAEVRMRPDGEAVGWVQRGVGPAELMIAPVGTTRPGARQLDVGPPQVLATLPPISAPHPSGGGAWSWLPDSSGVVYASRGGLYLAPVDGGPIRAIVMAGEGRSLWSPTVDPSGRLLAYVDEGAEDAKVMVVELAPTAARHELVGTVHGLQVSPDEQGGFVVDPEWGADGLIAWHAWGVPSMPWDSSRIEIAQVEIAQVEIGAPAEGQSISVGARGRIVGGRLGQPRWSGRRLAWIDDESGFAVVTTGVVRGDADRLIVDAVGRLSDSFEHAGPTWGPGQRTVAWSPDGSVVAFERNENGFGRLCVDRPGPSADGGTFGGDPLGRGVHGSLSWTQTVNGDDRLAALRQGATTPVQVAVYSRMPDEVTHQSVWVRTVVASSAVIGWDEVELVEPIEVAVPSFDGVTVPGRLYRPSQGIEPLPTIVAVHGGPTDQSRVEWNPRFASYAAVGWQVLVVDHRGSTGWGREHQQAMNERWGELDVADVVAVVDALVASGRVDPHRVVISGGSAGGFTVLSALVAHPGLFAGGIALYPVTDLIALDESTHRFEAHYQQTLIGKRPEHDERYIGRSPLHRASAIRVPLLLFHGTDDKVVDIAQSDQLAAVLGAHGVPLDYTRFDGEGHGWSKPETIATEHRTVMEFLSRIMNPN